MEEAVAAFLVVPTPQNLLLPRDTSRYAPSKPAENEAPLHCILYSLRLLECLGEYVTDANKAYFTSMSLLDDRSFGLNAWLPVYPTRRPASDAQKRLWVDPVCRLYKKCAKKPDDIIGLKKAAIDLLTSPLPKLMSPSKQKKDKSIYVDESDDDAAVVPSGSDSDFSDKNLSEDDDDDTDDDELVSEGISQENSSAGVGMEGGKAVVEVVGRKIARLPAPPPFGSIPSATAGSIRELLYKLVLQHKSDLQKHIADENLSLLQQIEEEKRKLAEETKTLCDAAVARAIATNFAPPKLPMPNPGRQDWQKNLHKSIRKPVLDAIDHLIGAHKDWFGYTTAMQQHEFSKDIELRLLMTAVNEQLYTDMLTLPSRVFNDVKKYIKRDVYESFCVVEEDEPENTTAVVAATASTEESRAPAEAGEVESNRVTPAQPETVVV